MGNPTQLIIGLLLYITIVSTLFGIIIAGMGGEDTGTIGVDYTPPSEEGNALSWIPYVGETLESAGFVGSVVAAILGVLFWTFPETIFPAGIGLLFNLIFIKIPLVGLIFAVLDVLLP